MNWKGKRVLVTGGSGSFGNAFTERILKEKIRKLIIFSRDEFKQWNMAKKFPDKRIGFFVGNVRDKERLRRAFDGVDVVVHAAALKQIPSCEYNPFEAVKTNVLGAQNVIEAAIDMGVEKVIALSSDKAVSPLNLYGATKLTAEKLFVAANSYAGGKNTIFSVVRYGNVLGSRGSVLPLFKEKARKGEPLPITDLRMTRFWITLEQGVNFVLKCFEKMAGGEIFIPKIPSMWIKDLAQAISAVVTETGIRPGEKLHETLISKDESRQCLEFDDYYVIKPSMSFRGKLKIKGGSQVREGFKYTSNKNPKWLTVKELKELI